MKKVSLSVKLVVGFVLSGLVPATLISLIVYYQNSKTIKAEAFKKLIAVRESKAFQLEELYKTMFGQVSALAQNSSTVEAMYEFENGFNSYNEEVELPISFNNTNKDFYLNQFGATFNKTNPNIRFNHMESTLGALSVTAQKLQYNYISKNKHPLGEKDQLNFANDGSSYSKVHKRYHPSFRTYLKKFGFYDIFLVSAKTGNVVYSVFKELDYGTSLLRGPYTESGLGKIFQKALTAKSTNDIFITDIAKYFPSYQAPAQFISAPIYFNNEIIGALVFQIPLAKINEIMTGREQWSKQGQGESGETYLVGHDKSMRSVSRFLVEDPKGFFEVMTDIGTLKSSINYMKAKKTTVLAAKVDTEGTTDVLAGKTGAKIFSDYRKVNVLSAFRPVVIEGLRWGILSEMDEEEALESLHSLQNIIIGLTVFAALIIFLSALFFSKKISMQLVSLSEVLKDGADNVLASSNKIADTSSELSSATNEQAASLQQSSSSINEISAMVTRSSEYASKTQGLAQDSQKKAEEGKRSIQQVKYKMDNIHDSNKKLVINVEENNEEFAKINDIIQEISNKTAIINDIVFQTKLLSFNASVEAARAGEHGKGFSVVAEEIGALAEMSGTAATEISGLLERSAKQVSDSVESSKTKMRNIIEDGQGKLNEGVLEIDKCSKALEEILSSFKEVNKSIAEVASSSNEQAAGVKEITMAIQQLDAVTHQNTGIANESSSKASELKNQSHKLASVVSQIQTIVFGAKRDPSEVMGAIEEKVEIEENKHLNEQKIA